MSVGEGMCEAYQDKLLIRTFVAPQLRGHVKRPVWSSRSCRPPVLSPPVLGNDLRFGHTAGPVAVVVVAVVVVVIVVVVRRDIRGDIRGI